MKKLYTSKSDETVWWAATFSSECKAFHCTESDVLCVKLPLNSVNHTAEEYSGCTGVAYRCGMSHTDDAQCSCWAMLQFSLSEQMSSLWMATGHCPDRWPQLSKRCWNVTIWKTTGAMCLHWTAKIVWILPVGWRKDKLVTGGCRLMVAGNVALYGSAACYIQHPRNVVETLMQNSDACVYGPLQVHDFKNPSPTLSQRQRQVVIPQVIKHRYLIWQILDFLQLISLTLTTTLGTTGVQSQPASLTVTIQPARIQWWPITQWWPRT